MNKRRMGATITNNLSVDKEDQQFVTPIRIYQFEQRHLWTKERPTCHKMPQAILIILHEVQIGETQRCTGSLQRNSKRKKCQIENAYSQDEFR